MHLYPKNYTDTGNLRVVKTDAETNKAVEGATIAIMQLTADNEKTLTGLLEGGLLSGKPEDIENTLKEYAVDGSLQYDVIEDADNGLSLTIWCQVKPTMYLKLLLQKVTYQMVTYKRQL